MVKPATDQLLIWWPQAGPGLRSGAQAGFAANPELRDELHGELHSEPHCALYYELHSAQGACLHSGHATLQDLHRRPWEGPVDGVLRAPSRVRKPLPPVLVLLHPANVLLLDVNLPAVRGRKLDEALPYVVEPALLNAPEDNYVTLVPNSARPMAAVVAKALVAQVLASCKAAQLNCHGITCELLRSPSPKPLVWLQGEYAVWLDGQAPPLCVPTQPVELARHALAQRCQGVRSVLVLGAVNKNSKGFKTLKALLPEGMGLEATKSEPCLGLLNTCLVPRHAAHQLGLQAASGANPGMRWQPWAWGALALGVLWGLGLNVAAWHTHSRQQTLEAQVAARFHEVLPNTPMVADPVLLLERELRSAAGASATQTMAGQGVVAAFNTVANALPEAPAHALRGMVQEGTSLEFLFATPLATDSQNRVVQALQAQGYVATWQAARLRVQLKEMP